MSPSDPEPSDRPSREQGQDDSPREEGVIRPLSKEQREAAVRKIKDLHDKITSGEAAGDETAATTHSEDVSVSGTVPVPEGDLLMLDPSFLFSEDGIAWLQEERRGVREEEVVISSTFMAWLLSDSAREDLMDLVAPVDLEAINDRRGILSRLLEASPTFSWEAADLQGPDAEVLLALRERGDVVGAILSDEWAFLQSHSWALSKLHLPLDAFRDAGSAVVEYGRRLREEMVSVVIPKKGAPPAITGRLLAKASAKWLIVGGAGAGGALLGPIGAGILGSGVTVPVVRAFDP
jgi:hypothetical protein